MIKHFLLTAVRSISRHKRYSTINILGLAAGLAATILIALFVQDELNYDSVFPPETYRIYSSIKMPGGKFYQFDSTDYVTAKGVLLDFPEVALITRLVPEDFTLQKGQVKSNETIYWADSTLFSVLPMKAVAGDVTSALEGPNAIVLDRSMSRKYFGLDDSVGKTLTVGGSHAMRVTAVVEDLPSNTHLDAHIFGSGRSAFSKLNQFDSRRDSFHVDTSAFTYLRLKHGSSIDDLRAKLPQFVATRLHIPPKNAFGIIYTLTAIPLGDIHFSAAGINAMKPPGDMAIIVAAAIIGGLILLAACINFVNLATARISRRYVEVGMRKSLGATRMQLIAQLILETFVQVGVSAILAVSIAELLLPVFNAFMRRQMVFAYWRPDIFLPILGMVLLVSFLAGIYPALLLSDAQPASALKGTVFLEKGMLRRGLVFVQFAILSSLLVSTAVVWRQTQFAMNASAKFAEANVLMVTGPCTDFLRNGFATISGVRAVACSQSLAGAENHAEMMETSPTSIHTFDTIAVDFGFLELYGLKPLAGRTFVRAQGGDVAPPLSRRSEGYEERIVINETAFRELGFSSPNQVIGLHMQASMARGQKTFLVIGVIPDMVLQSVRLPVRPTAYFVDPSQLGILNLSVEGKSTGDIADSIRRIWNRGGQAGLAKIVPLSSFVALFYEDIWRESVVISAAALLTVLIASLGLFGMASFIAERRTKEIGIRKCMGAGTAAVMGMLVWQFMQPIVWANVVAWPVAWWIMHRWLQTFAYHVSIELWIFIGVGLITCAVALLTMAGQAFWVASQRPVGALRYE